MELFRHEKGQEFAKKYGIAFAHINFIDHWFGQFLFLVKYPEFLAMVEGEKKDVEKEIRLKLEQIESMTLGQKIVQLKNLNYADPDLIQKLEELNQERKILAHFPSGEDEMGDVYFHSMFNSEELSVKHDFDKIIKLSDELHELIGNKFGEMGLG